MALGGKPPRKRFLSGDLVPGAGPPPPPTYLPPQPTYMTPITAAQFVAGLLPGMVPAPAPQQNAMTQALTAVSGRVEALNAVARKLGEHSGVRGEPHLLTELSSNPNLALMQALTQGHSWFQLTRSQDGWGIHHYEGPSLLEATRNPASTKVQMVTNANAHVKQVFLDHAEKLFTDYLGKMNSALEKISQRIKKADSLLEQLGNMF